MVLDEIVLHNVGVYRGRQTVQLTPPSRKKPIILIGGLNGGGKTTLLDTLQLVLYGKLARCATRGHHAYDDFLRRSIHRAVHPSEGAALELQFRHTLAGKEHVYRLHRSWRQSGSGIREHVEVLHDGSVDHVLTDAWPEYVETLLPLRIASLFFFDGEQIEGLADAEHSAQVLATAMQALLGLDLVDQLLTDLVVLERRKRTVLKNDVERGTIDAAQAEVERLVEQREACVTQCAALRNEVERCQKRLRDIAQRLRTAGGDLLDRRESLEQERASVAQQLNETEALLRDLAAGPAPLVLVADLLQTLAQQDCCEEEAAQAALLAQVLTERDTHLLEAAKRSGASVHLLRALNTFLSADRETRAAASTIESYVSLSPETREQLRLLQVHTLADAQRHIHQHLDTVATMHAQLTDFDRQLASIPDRDTLTHLLEEQQQARAASDAAHQRLALAEAELERLTRERDQKQARLVATIEHTVDATFEQEAVTRIINASQRVRTTLAQFRTAVLVRHVRRIEQLVLESFKHLLHKTTLVTDLTIDPADCSVHLRRDGEMILPERLSAGERQLLAVSLLWGLGRASGHPLPAVIDTPLGRLDALHRTYLVERYFPHASHQVILLSTDEEIDEIYYAKLRPWVGRTYLLEFDEASDATRVRPGYFW
jgi:DNA sulfur modification protein DndD